MNSHLNADRKTNDKRNKDLLLILDRLVENEVYEEVFIFGDLNYRLSVNKEYAASLYPHQKFLSLIKHDSLRQQSPLKTFLEEFT